jgi:nucleoside-diphosphate-sugar epimerase
MRRALVTGATGMLGSYIVERLLEWGWGVRALVRGDGVVRASSSGKSSPRAFAPGEESAAAPPAGGEAAAWLRARGAEQVQGRIEDVESVVRAAAGCDAVFHAAALIGSGGDWEAFHRGNVLGTSNVLAAASAAGARLVHVSSTAVYGSARYRDEPTDESAPLPTLPDEDVYGRSKQDAERLVLEAHRAGRLWASVVRPPMMYGRRDRQFAPRVGPVLERGVFPLIAGGRTTLTLVHAASVAEGAVLAAQNDVAGGRVYLLANDHPVTAADLVRGAEKGLGRRIWSPIVSARVGRGGFCTLQHILRVMGRGDLARHARGTLDMLTRGNPFTSDRARRELGWAPSLRPEAGLPDAFGWWKAHRAPTGAGGR